MRGIIYWFARNGVVANLLLVLIAASGLLTVGNLKQEVFPEFSLDTIAVTLDYRGAAPVEVEEAICVRVEEAVQDLEGVKKITSRASEGRGSVTIQVQAGYDVREILADIKTRVDAIDTFPEDVEKPVISEFTSRNQVINVAVAGNADLSTLKRVGEKVRDDLTALPEISQGPSCSMRRHTRFRSKCRKNRCDAGGLPLTTSPTLCGGIQSTCPADRSRRT